MPMLPLFHLQSPIPQLRDESRDRDQALQDDSGFFTGGDDGGELQTEERR